MDGVWNPHTPPVDLPLQSAYHSDGYSDPSAGNTLDNKSHFPLQDPEEWQVDDVLLWLAATNNYLYAEVFRECEITGAKLREMTDVKLAQMNISDSTHKQSLLLAIQELFTGLSETVSLLQLLTVICSHWHYPQTVLVMLIEFGILSPRQQQWGAPGGEIVHHCGQVVGCVKKCTKLPKDGAHYQEEKLTLNKKSCSPIGQPWAIHGVQVLHNRV